MKHLVKRMSVLTTIIALSILLSPHLYSAFLRGSGDHDLIAETFQTRQSNLMVETKARVVRLMPDIDDLGKFQEFKIELENGHQVRVIHDLQQAPRVPVSVSSKIRLRGEYDWSVDGGVIHWTHDDPDGQREGGWIEFMGEKFL